MADPVPLKLPTERPVAAVTAAVLRDAARRRLPRPIFDYIDGGSYRELTMAANRADLDALTFRQRAFSEVSSRSQRTSFLGIESTMPVALGPVGFAGLIHPYAEVRAAQAAEEFGVPFCLSTFSLCSIEDVAAAVTKPFLFQLYMFSDPGINGALMARAREAGCPALLLTMDHQIQGRRDRDLENGLSIPLRLSPGFVLGFARKPRWTVGWLRSRRHALGNLAMFNGVGNSLTSGADWLKRHYKHSIAPSDLEWIRRNWTGKLVVKGILDAEDARRAVDIGADAVLVSNHGGRQLDGSPTTVRAFPAIAEAVGDRAELLFDSGIRSGLDVLKALGLGARACFLGRAYLYGLGAHGGAGAVAALRLIEDELDAAMALTGVDDINALPPDLLLADGAIAGTGRTRHPPRTDSA